MPVSKRAMARLEAERARLEAATAPPLSGEPATAALQATATVPAQAPGAAEREWSPADYGEYSDTAFLLSVSLAAAVPLLIWEWSERIRREGEYAWERMERRARECCEAICGPGGEYLLFRDRTGNHRTAAAFGALAEGLAIMSFCSGGVRAFGNRWETKWPSPGE
jgi:hypothetical protein